MAKFYQLPSGDTGLRRSAEEERFHPIPGNAAVVEFDEATNLALLDSLDGKVPGFLWQDHAIVNGRITRKGQPMALLPDGPGKVEKKKMTDLIGQVNAGGNLAGKDLQDAVMFLLKRGLSP